MLHMLFLDYYIIFYFYNGGIWGNAMSFVLLNGSETWAPTSPDLQRLRRNDRSMIRWICGVKPHDEIFIDLLCARLGIQEVTAALRSKRLRWYGLVIGIGWKMANRLIGKNRKPNRLDNRL